MFHLYDLFLTKSLSNECAFYKDDTKCGNHLAEEIFKQPKEKLS